MKKYQHQVTRIAGAGVAALLAASAAAGQSADHDDRFEQRFQQMQSELERLNQENQDMRAQLRELRASQDENWLTEQRAEEIRSIVQDVLADADTRASLLGDGLMAGWRDGFFLASADGRFKLNLQGQMQIRWVYNYHDQPDRHLRGFENTRTRLTFSGHAFTPDLTYLVRGQFGREGTGALTLLDGWVRYHLNNEWSVRIGQFKLPFSREFLVSSAFQQAAERSLVDRRLGLGRSQGIELLYATDQSRFAFVYSDGAEDTFLGPAFPGTNIMAGTSPTTNTAALNPTSEVAITARYEHLFAGNWRQFQDFTSPGTDEFGLMAGIAAHYQTDPATGAAANFTGQPQRSRWLGYTVDVSAEWGGANVFAAFTHHYVETRQIGVLRDNINMFGLVLQGGVYVSPKVELFTRYEFGTWSFDPSPAIDDLDNDLHLISAGVNYYLDGHDVKWTTDIGFGISRISRNFGGQPIDVTGWRAEGPNARPQIVFRTQFQLLF